MSNLVLQFVQTGDTPQRLLSQLAAQLAARDIEGALTNFSPSARNREWLEQLTPEMRTVLANGLLTTTLLTSQGATRVYAMRLAKPDGTSLTTKLGLAQTEDGRWFVMFW